jgi:hypothetical protein
VVVPVVPYMYTNVMHTEDVYCSSGVVFPVVTCTLYVMDTEVVSPIVWCGAPCSNCNGQREWRTASLPKRMEEV